MRNMFDQSTGNYTSAGLLKSKKEVDRDAVTAQSQSVWIVCPQLEVMEWQSSGYVWLIVSSGF